LTIRLVCSFRRIKKGILTDHFLSDSPFSLEITGHPQYVGLHIPYGGLFFPHGESAAGDESATLEEPGNVIHRLPIAIIPIMAVSLHGLLLVDSLSPPAFPSNRILGVLVVKSHRSFSAYIKKGFFSLKKDPDSP
jgi:hypothetical protein